MATAEETTKAKERALGQGVQVWVLEPGKRYVAPSATNEGTAYEIVVQSPEQDDITCTCPGATYRGICKHIGAIMLRQEASHPQVNEQLEQDIAGLYR
jgi:uncharacterized Zn finger protein